MDPLEQFSAIVAEERFRVAEALLAFARTEYTSLDTGLYLDRLDRLGDGLRPRMGADPGTALRHLGEHLVAHGFRGNTDDYYDHRNSSLNEVLDRGLGIPISLSVLWIDIGGRAGLPLCGVGLPMHFLVGLQDENVYADPFGGGRILGGAEAVVAFFENVTGGRFAWRDGYLEPTPDREIVRRALTNLKAVYSGTGRLGRALRTQEFILAVPGWPPTEMRERAGILAGLGRYPEAIADLRRYAGTDPEDAEAVDREIRRLLATMN